MKKTVIFVLICILLCACNGNTDKGNVDVLKPAPLKQEGKSQVRLINVDGEIYYDTDIVDKTPRCGNFDGTLSKSANEFEIPATYGGANFDTGTKCFGYQNISDICKDVFIEGNVKKFKKMPDVANYKYCYRITGTHPNAVKQSEYIVVANTQHVTFEDITKYFFSSQIKDHNVDFEIIFPHIEDEWGITLYIDNVTPKGVTLNLEQFGGKVSGTLQCGSDYYIEKYNDGKWEKLDTKDGHPLVWNAIAYEIPMSRVTSFNISFEFGYGKLDMGRYRISKNIMDFIKSGQFEQKTYYAEFEII